jgi:hypothetical protein
MRNGKGRLLRWNEIRRLLVVFCSGRCNSTHRFVEQVYIARFLKKILFLASASGATWRAIPPESPKKFGISVLSSDLNEREAEACAYIEAKNFVIHCI